MDCLLVCGVCFHFKMRIAGMIICMFVCLFVFGCLKFSCRWKENVSWSDIKVLTYGSRFSKCHSIGINKIASCYRCMGKFHYIKGRKGKKRSLEKWKKWKCKCLRFVRPCPESNRWIETKTLSQNFPIFFCIFVRFRIGFSVTNLNVLTI